jgi:hypothetical protein
VICGTAKLQHQTPVEIEPQRTPIRLTRRVPHCRPAWSPTRYSIPTQKRRECVRYRDFIRGMRGQLVLQLGHGGRRILLRAASEELLQALADRPYVLLKYSLWRRMRALNLFSQAAIQYLYRR